MLWISCRTARPALPIPSTYQAALPSTCRILAVCSSCKRDDWLGVRVREASGHNAARYEARLEVLEVDESYGIPDSVEDYAAA